MRECCKLVACRGTGTSVLRVDVREHQCNRDSSINTLDEGMDQRELCITRGVVQS